MFLVNVEKCLKVFDKVYVSSDSTDIIKQAQDIGAVGILRPVELCGDTPNMDVYTHAMSFLHADGIVAVQANSPTVTTETIQLAKDIMELGVQEVMTCHPDGQKYGSVWGLTRERIANYVDPYKPTPEVLIVDTSIDIHTEEDLNQALCQLT